jgi:hypothetical protein
MPINPGDETAGLCVPQMRVSDILLPEHGLQDLLKRCAAHPALCEQCSTSTVAFDNERERAEGIR